MSAAVPGRNRLQKALMTISRKPHARGAVCCGVAPDGLAGKVRLQRALQELGRRASVGVTVSPPPAEAPGGRARGARATPAGPEHPLDLAALDARLDRIEARLEGLRNPLRSGTPAREIFLEWIRNGRWEEVRFGDFLRLRRAGLL